MGSARIIIIRNLIRTKHRHQLDQRGCDLGLQKTGPRWSRRGGRSDAILPARNRLRVPEIIDVVRLVLVIRNGEHVRGARPRVDDVLIAIGEHIVHCGRKSGRVRGHRIHGGVAEGGGAPDIEHTRTRRHETEAIVRGVGFAHVDLHLILVPALNCVVINDPEAIATEAPQGIRDHGPKHIGDHVERSAASVAQWARAIGTNGEGHLLEVFHISPKFKIDSWVS